MFLSSYDKIIIFLRRHGVINSRAHMPFHCQRSAYEDQIIRVGLPFGRLQMIRLLFYLKQIKNWGLQQKSYPIIRSESR